MKYPHATVWIGSLAGMFLSAWTDGRIAPALELILTVSYACFACAVFSGFSSGDASRE